MIAKNLIIMFTLVIIVFVGMWAWFTSGSSATASGINITCKTTEGVEIAIVPCGSIPTNSDFATSHSARNETPNPIDLTTLGGSGTFLDMVDVTSDGTSFLIPKLVQSDGIATPTPSQDLLGTDGGWNSATVGNDYVSFDLYLRSQGTPSVCFGSGSGVSTIADVLVGAEAGNKSSYGDFSSDCVVGATRISVTHPVYEETATAATGDETNELRLLWIPRPDIYLDTTDGIYSVLTYYDNDGNRNASFTDDILASNSIHTYWTNETKTLDDGTTQQASQTKHTLTTTTLDGEAFTAPNSSKLVVSTPAVGGAVLGSNDKTIATLTHDPSFFFKETDELGAKTGSGDSATYTYDYNYDKVTVNLWIEGEDAEARRAMAGGQFKINVNLEAVTD